MSSRISLSPLPRSSTASRPRCRNAAISVIAGREAEVAQVDRSLECRSVDGVGAGALRGSRTCRARDRRSSSSRPAPPTRKSRPWPPRRSSLPSPPARPSLPWSPMQVVIAVAAIDEIVAAAGEDGVVAVPGEDLIVTTEPEYDVVIIGAVEPVIVRRAEHEFL